MIPFCDAVAMLFPEGAKAQLFNPSLASIEVLRDSALEKTKVRSIGDGKGDKVPMCHFAFTSPVWAFHTCQGRGVASYVHPSHNYYRLIHTDQYRERGPHDNIVVQEALPLKAPFFTVTAQCPSN